MAKDDAKKINIKKKKSNSPIFYGIMEDTGTVVTVDNVERGLACGCICPSCGTRLEARKGESRAHHFAHETNKECLYGAEISIYHAFYELLNTSKRFFLPDAILSFNSRKKDELVKKGSLISLTEVEYNNDSITYPPELLCYSGSKCFQIILDFESYYDKKDYQSIKEYGKQHNIAVVSVAIEKMESLTTFDALQEYIDTPMHKQWIYNRLIEEWDVKYRQLAITPTPFEFGYLCLAQKNQYKNVYSAQVEDCLYCQYCYDHMQEKFCIAHSYVNHVEDFHKSEKERKQQFYDFNHLKPIKKINEYTCPRCGSPMKKRIGPKGIIFAGCSKFPQCRGTRRVEQTTEQVIIEKTW